MSPEQQFATISLRTTNLMKELHQLNLLRNKVHRANLSAIRSRNADIKERGEERHDQDCSERRANVVAAGTALVIAGSM